LNTLSITGVTHTASATTAVATVADLGTLAVNDIVTIWGLNKDLNGTYAVTGINADAKTFNYTVKSTATADGSITVSGNAKAVSYDFDADLNFKLSVIEGGGLYTLKIANWDNLFNLS
jgi:hypothetical protein